MGAKRPGPSAESWHKDGIDMGKEIRVFDHEEKGPSIQEFKDLFSMADAKIKHTAAEKVR